MDCESEIEMNQSRMVYIELARECFFQYAYETGAKAHEFAPDSAYQAVLERLGNPGLYPQDKNVFDQYLARHGLRCVQSQTLESGGTRITVGLIPEGTYLGGETP